MYVLYLILCKIEVISDKYGLFVLTILVTIPELQQNYESVRNMFGPSETSDFGFEDIQNFYELTGYILQIAYLSMRMVENGGVKFSKSTVTRMDGINLVSCMLIFIRAFFLFRVFSSLRPLVRMIKEVVSGLMPFTTIMTCSSVFFSVEVYLLFEEDNHLGLSKKVHTYSSIAGDQISIIASGEYSSDNMPVTTPGFVVYFIAYYFIVVCLMNLLIAIITERY